MKSLATVLLAVASSLAFAQTTTTTKTAPAPFNAQVGTATIAPSKTTTYEQPNTGPTGEPIPGNKRGSTTTDSYGVTVKIPLPSK